ncbi:glycerol kinase GlpK [bacterium]|nr:glycerol kinase GlpK [bacterium]
MADYIMALDQGTTSSRALIFDREGRTVGVARRPLTCHYPASGWVEQDPQEIATGQVEAAREALQAAGLAAGDLAAVGIANQRETTLVWERATGRPVAPAIVWQCRRTAGLCEQLRAQLGDDFIREHTGLVIDPYFSATKLQWILNEVEGARARAERGELLFGTVDTWLLWNLTDGRRHVTDVSNASRTMLLNLHTRQWDEEILAALDIPPTMLPQVCPSSGELGELQPDVLGAAVPLTAAIGDQQAALFGQACFAPGMAKSTYGTGCFLLMNTGARPVPSHHGLLSTVGWSVGGTVEYALEGSVFVAGAAVQWLRDQLGLIQTAPESEAVAQSVPDTGGVYFVPAFVGLGAPHWDDRARGTLVGLTRGTERAHIVRAALEAVAYQTADVLQAMAADRGAPLTELRVDGGAAANDFLLQFQADVLGVPVVRPRVLETTALGAAYLAGLAVGCWPDQDTLAGQWALDRRFEPAMADERRQELLAGWRRAVVRARDWISG